MRRARAWGWLLMGVSVAACGERAAPAPASSEEEAPAPPATDVVLDAAWSPDGQRIAATWDRGGGPRLFGLLGPTRDGEPPAAGTGLPLTRGTGGQATWAPDGLWIAYTSGGDLVRARPDGTGPEKLTEGPGDDRDPDYAPDGRRIVFVSDRGGDGDRLWVIPAAGGEPTELSGAAVGPPHLEPAWAPGGGVIAFTAQEDVGRVIYVASSDGGGFGRVGEGSAPTWSPDGARVYFHQNDSLFWRPADGGLRRFVVANGRAPAASPDGRWLAFVRGTPPSVALWLVDLETGAETRVTP